MKENQNKQQIPYLDEKVTAVNREINKKFYGEDSNQDDDSNLYNLGDSTPTLNDDNRE